MIACALSLVLTTALSVVDYIPTNDGPNTILHGWLALHLNDPGKGYAHFLEANRNPTSLAFDLPFVTLLHFMPWRDALRLTLSLGALVWAWGFLALVAALEPRRLALGAFGFATALSWSFYMGFFSYWLTCGLVLLLIALALFWETWSARRLVVLGAAVFVVALGHTLPAMVLGLLLAALVFARHSGRERIKALCQLALAGVPSLLVVALASRGASSAIATEAMQDDPLRTTWLSLPDLLAMPARCFTAGPLWRSAPPPLLALAGITFTLVRARRGRASRNELGLAAAALLLLVLSLAMPLSFEVWKLMSPRFVPFWVMIGIALLPLEALPFRDVRIAASALGVAFALAALVWSAGFHLNLADHEADGLALAGAPIKRSGARLPLKLTPSYRGVLYDDSGVNIPMLYTIEQGGMVPDLFATQPAVHPHLYRGTRAQLFPPFPGRFYGDLFQSAGLRPGSPPKPVQLAYLAMLGAAYEDVILISEVADADAFIARGYVVDRRRGQAALVHYRGCGLVVDIASAAPQKAPLLVEYGWSPLLRAVDQRVVAPAADGGSVQLSFPAAPCGPVWVRVIWDNDGSGARSAGDGYCRESNPLQLIDTTIASDHDHVTCTAP